MTTYRVSAAVRDMHRVVSLLRDQRRRCPPLLYPVVLAEDSDRTVLAACGTHVLRGLVCGGPIVIRDGLGRRAWVVMYRLGEIYDHALAQAGVRTYYGYVDAALGQWQYVLERLGFEPVTVDGERDGQWYRREAGTPWGQQIDSSHAEPVDGVRQRLAAVPIDGLGR